MATSLRQVAVATYELRAISTDSRSLFASNKLKALSRSHSVLYTSRTYKRPPICARNSVKAFHTSPPAQSASKFSYGVAASFTAKDRRYDPESNVFIFDLSKPVLKPRKEKRDRPDSGQDSFFISRVDSTTNIAIGVADGVGGWIDSGVDPADFAHGFCDYMAYEAYTYQPKEGKPALTARSLMQKGYEDICNDRSVRAGGSTACVAIARGDGTLEVANLGDSGFVQLRLNAIHNYSEPQTHAFNTPYQLSIVPKKVLRQSAFFGGARIEDFPKDANVSQHSLRHGDVLVFASDGVWDNLSSQDILRIVSRLMVDARAWRHTDEGIRVGPGLQQYVQIEEGRHSGGSTSNLQSFLAVGITSEAKAASVNTKINGPFAKEVHKYYPDEDWRGGKVDDICVVVAVAIEEGNDSLEWTCMFVYQTALHERLFLD